MKTTLLTAVGSASASSVVALLHALGHRVIGCDIYPQAWNMASNEVDVFFQAVMCTDREAYIRQMEEAVAREKSVEQAAVEKDDSFRVHMALHALEEPYREVFELRVFGELSFAQIGQIFHRTENWARVTFHRARAKLKERMEEK
jgi:RNA polymerase sigma factor (sigma-70 family)